MNWFHKLVDHKTLCLSFFTRPLLGIPQRHSGPLFDVSYTAFRENLRTVKPNLPKGQATHVLRHTFGTHFMMNGGSIITLQRIMGHANIMQTMVYAHFAPDFLRDAISHNPLAKSVHILSIDMV